MFNVSGSMIESKFMEEKPNPAKNTSIVGD
jgi:hypothetical protein